MPRHAVGPELTQLFVGSEGTLGVITRATLQLVPLPDERRFAAVSFPSVGGRHRRDPARAAARLPAVGGADVRRGRDAARVRAGRRRGPERDLHRVRVRGRRRGGAPGGAPHDRARPGRGRRGARPGARAALVGPPLRLLPPARTTPSCRRSGARSTSSRPTTASARSTTRCTPRCASRTPTPGSSCGCTSPTGTCGAR